MTWFVLLVLAFAAVLSGEAAAGLRQGGVVQGSVVRLGDLFDDAGPAADQPVAAAPAPGRKLVFDAVWLEELARIHRLAWRPASRYDRVEVERASRRIESAQVVDALRAAVEDAIGRRNSDIELFSRDLGLTISTDLPPTVEVRNLQLDRSGGRFTADVVAGGGAPGASRATLSGRFHTTSSVPVPRRPIAGGEIITAGDIEWARLRDDRLPAGVATASEELIGRAPRARLRAGEPVRTDDVRLPVVVEKNATVTIVLRTPAMVLTAVGRALQAGGTNDTIQVMNLQSKKVIHAAVVDPGTVTVLVNPRLAAE